MINWKIRFQNKAFISALCAWLIASLYQLFAILGFIPPVSEEQVVQAVGFLITLLAGLGIIVDGTTPGIGDSELALSRGDIEESYEDSEIILTAKHAKVD